MGLPRDAEDAENAEGIGGPAGASDLEEWLVPVRRALVARYGVEVGAEAAAEAATWAVEHRQRLATMANPAGYLYRVGQTAASKAVRWGRRQIRFAVETADLAATDAPPIRHERST